VQESVSEKRHPDLSTPRRDPAPVAPRVLAIHCFNGLRIHASVFEALHYRTSRKPIPQTKVDFDTIFSAVSEWTPPESASQIARSLQKHFADSNAHVTGFRASTVYGFNDDDLSWPVIEWKEDNDTDVIALFYPDEETSTFCSWLLHYGKGRTADGERWKHTSISWCVAEMSHLKSLFRIAQHLLGILEWSMEDILTLYCKRDAGNCTDEAYVLWELIVLIFKVEAICEVALFSCSED
jgi:hypothetical protein